MNTAKSWEAWGRDDPYYGVLSLERFRRGRLPDNRDEFFASGRDYVAQTLDRYERRFGALPPGAALDFGCGVGRLTLPLARRFETVTGIDIAASMLTEAQRNADEAGCANVRFVQGDCPAAAPGAYAFVNCYIVLQHVPMKRGLALLSELLERVAPGGGCLIHLTVRRPPSMARRALYWLRFNVPALRPLLNLAAGRPMGDPSVRMEEYPLPEVLRIFSRAGLPEVLIAPEDHAGTLAVTLLARKMG